jgi:transcriptional regulator with XRE-family HTH domain
MPRLCSVGANIVRHRNKLDLTQADLVAILQRRGFDITRACLAHIETGRQRLHVPLLEALCRALGVAPNELLGWTEDRPASEAETRLQQLQPFVEDVLHQIRKIAELPDRHSASLLPHQKKRRPKSG